MEKINQLTSTLESGVVPEGHDEKKMKKLIKKWKELGNPQVVKLYPIRRVAHEDSRYCVYACPFHCTEINEETLQQITTWVDQVEVGHIRHNSMMASGSYFQLSEEGIHLFEKEYWDAIVEISNQFPNVILFSDAVLSPKKTQELDCHYAIIGLDSQPNQYEVVMIPNVAIGEETKKQIFKSDLLIEEKEEESPGVEKLRTALLQLSAIITIGILIWYLFFQ